MTQVLLSYQRKSCPAISQLNRVTTATSLYPQGVDQPGQVSVDHHLPVQQSPQTPTTSLGTKLLGQIKPFLYINNFCPLHNSLDSRILIFYGLCPPDQIARHRPSIPGFAILLEFQCPGILHKQLWYLQDSSCM